MSKWFLKSKTVVANGLAFGVAIFGPVVAEWVGYTGEVPENLQPFVVPAILLINLGLRAITNQGVTLSRS